MREGARWTVQQHSIACPRNGSSASSIKLAILRSYRVCMGCNAFNTKAVVHAVIPHTGAWSYSIMHRPLYSMISSQEGRKKRVTQCLTRESRRGPFTLRASLTKAVHMHMHPSAALRALLFCTTHFALSLRHRYHLEVGKDVALKKLNHVDVRVRRHHAASLQGHGRVSVHLRRRDE